MMAAYKYEVNPLITTQPKNVFKSLWYTYVREMAKPKPISIASQIKEDLYNMKWGRYEGWIGDGMKGYYLRYPESMPDEVLEELNELNDRNIENKGIVMPYTPAEKWDWEAQSIGMIADWINGATEFLSMNEDILIPAGMKKLPFTNTNITKKIIGYLKTAVVFVSTFLVGRYNGNRQKIIESIGKFPTKETFSRALKHTYLKNSARLAFAISDPILKLKDDLQDENTDVGIAIANCITTILNDIETKYVDSFANAVVAIKAEMMRRKEGKKSSRDAIDVSALNSILTILGKEFGEMLDNIEKEKNNPEVIIPEVVSSSISKTESAPIPMLRNLIVSDQAVNDPETHPVQYPFNDPKQFEQTEANPTPMQQVQTQLRQMRRINDPSDNQFNIPIKPVVYKAKPEFINDANKVKNTPLEIAPDHIKSSIENVMESSRKYFINNLWALKICDTAVNKGFKCAANPIIDSADNVKLIEFITSREENGKNIVLDDKSFVVDLGQVINRDYIIWPCFRNGARGPLELCDYAFKLFKRTKTHKDVESLNMQFIEKIFDVGFSGLNKEDVSAVSAFNKKILDDNKNIVLISIPNDEMKETWRVIARKVSNHIKEFSKLYYNDPSVKGIELDKYKFVCVEADPNTLDMTFSSYNVPYYFMDPNSIRRDWYFVIRTKVRYDKVDDDGIPRIALDENNEPIIEISVEQHKLNA